MKTLDELRALIDAIDDRILDLLEQRASVAFEIADAKARAGRAGVYDPERERKVIERLVDAHSGLLPPSAVRAVYREIISACLALQRPLTVAYLGPEGTFSQMAALRLFGESAAYRDAATIEGVFDAVARGEATRGVVPLENSTEGSVAATIRGLLHGELHIERELVLDVAHSLLSRAPNLPAIRRVYSHPQALGQCTGWLRTNLPDVEWTQTTSTAAAVEHAAADPSAAAIGSRLAGELRGLHALVQNIHDNDDNATRFVVISADDAQPTGDDRTLVAFSLDDGPGALRRALSAFEDHGISLTRIESHPNRDRAWNYLFVAEMDGHRREEPVANALDALRLVCTDVRVLGSFPRFRRV